MKHSTQKRTATSKARARGSKKKRANQKERRDFHRLYQQKKTIAPPWQDKEFFFYAHQEGALFHLTPLALSSSCQDMLFFGESASQQKLLV